MSKMGSEWGRWDLHVHTKGTVKNDQFSSKTMDEFHVTLFREALNKNIKVIGITDYFNLRNYNKVKDFQDGINNIDKFSTIEKEMISKILLIPNVELRMLPSTDKGSLINIHFLISPSFVNEFENSIANKLEFTIGSHKYSLSHHDLIKLGKSNDASITEIDASLKKGCSLATLDYNKISEILLSHPEFKKNCIVVVSNSNSDGASSFQGHEKYLHQSEGSSLDGVRRAIYHLSDAIFSGNKNDVNFFLGKGKHGLEKYIEQCGSIKPCIHGCDAHSESKLFEPEDKKYCWIKAEPTFEGLKQILHEPETRVYIGECCPDRKNDYEIIDHIDIDDKDIENKKIYFNQNLTSIIGGRSSGKSTLLKCLSYKLKGNIGNTEQYIEEICKNVKIYWKDGKEDDSRQIEYFSQGHMYQKSTGNGIEKIIEDLLRQKNQDIFSEYEKEYAQSRSANSKLITDYFSIKDEITNLQENLKEKGNKEDIKNQIESIDKEINAKQANGISDDEMRFFSEQRDELINLQSELIILTQDSNNLFNKYYPEISDTIERITINLKGNYEEFNDGLEHIKSEFKERFSSYLRDLNNYICSKITNVKKKIEVIEKNDVFVKVTESLKDSEVLHQLIEKKTNEENKLRAIDNINNKIQELKNRSDESYKIIKEKWLSIFKHLDSSINTINKIEISDDLSIKAIKSFDRDSFNKFIEQSFDQRPSKTSEITESKVSTEQDLLRLFDKILSYIDDSSMKFKSSYNLAKFTKEFFDSIWFKKVFDIIYDGDSYSQMSQGKKAFVVLKLTLEFSNKTCPIIIDQPEDDLDNRSIFSELVSYLKKKKSERQIILVTHNANVVVNADSELVIVANQHGSKTPNDESKKFQYKYGSIESLECENGSPSILKQKTIKQHICEIVEGGDEAFKLREKKYNF